MPSPVHGAAKTLRPGRARPPPDSGFGDHPANDIRPARAAGLRTAHLRRGPWGHWWADDPGVRAAADWSIDSLTELPDVVKP